MLNLLKKRGLIKEYGDKEDKRSKRIELTVKGEKAIDECKGRIVKNAGMIMHDLTENDKELCIQLLKNGQIKFSTLWNRHRGKEFEEVYKEVTDSREILIPDSV